MSNLMSRSQPTLLTLLACCLAVACASTLAQSKPLQAPPMITLQTQPSTALRTFFDAQWERSLRESPETASYMGDTRFDERWTDFSASAIVEREAADRRALEELRAIGRTALSAADQLDYDTFEWQLLHSIERQKFREYLQPISHQGGVQTADGIAEVMPFASSADYAKWLARMRSLPVVIDQTLALMREGVKSANVPPRVLMERVAKQIAAQVVDDPVKSPFYRPFLKFDATIALADRDQLTAQAKAVIKDTVVPAFVRLQGYFNAEYLPHTRSTIALSDTPDGHAYYNFLARYYTSTRLSADEIHATGLREVARLRAAMEELKVQSGFKGTLSEFFIYLRSDPKFFYKTPEALLMAYRATAKRIDPELVKVFRVLPRQPYGVRPIPDNIAPDSPTGYYQPGATDGSRAGNYYVNLYKPEARPSWEMMPLTLHEAVPGHHFQFARALEMPGAPQFRKTAYFVAYSEGWALYAEQLGLDMGLYDDLYDRFGLLTYEMWRSVRLVVDTGMHAKGWSRERAIAYFKDNAAKTEQDIVNEVDRYIGTPAQALAYKIGQLKISQMRLRAKNALGAGFDLRDFNDAVLATGSVPLDTLERHMDGWIAQRKPGLSN